MMPRRLILIASILFCLGCSAAPGPLKKLSVPLLGNLKEQSLRKQVAADSFPTAKQAGL
jgi:hypothetical protein